MFRAQITFGSLVITQAAHSVEEYIGGLWDSFPPATFLTGLVATDREVGFLLINGALVAFGLWCLYWPVRRRWPLAVPLMWAWIGIEFVNGVGHMAWSWLQGAYTPGVGTAPVLLGLSVCLAVRLRQKRFVQTPAG